MKTILLILAISLTLSMSPATATESSVVDQMREYLRLNSAIILDMGPASQKCLADVKLSPVVATLQTTACVELDTLHGQIQGNYTKILAPAPNTTRVEIVGGDPVLQRLADTQIEVSANMLVIMVLIGN